MDHLKEPWLYFTLLFVEVTFSVVFGLYLLPPFLLLLKVSDYASEYCVQIKYTWNTQSQNVKINQNLSNQKRYKLLSFIFFPIIRITPCEVHTKPFFNFHYEVLQNTHWELVWKKVFKNVYDGEEAWFLFSLVDLSSPVKCYISFNLTRETKKKSLPSAILLLYCINISWKQLQAFWTTTPATLHLWHSWIKTDLVTSVEYSLGCSWRLWWCGLCTDRVDHLYVESVGSKPGISQSVQACAASLSMILLYSSTTTW